MSFNDANKNDVVSISDIKDYMNNTQKCYLNDKKEQVEEKKTFDFNGVEIRNDSSASVLIKGKNKRKYNRHADFHERQVDMFANLSVEEEKKDELENNKDQLIPTSNPFYPFSDSHISIDSEKNQIKISLIDENKTLGTDKFDVYMPIVDDKKSLVMLTTDNVEPGNEISDENFEIAVEHIDRIKESTFESISNSSKPVYSVYTMVEDDFVETMKSIQEEYGSKDFQYTKSVFSGKDYDETGNMKDYTVFKFSDKIMKEVDKRYSNLHDCENPDKKHPKYGVPLQVSDTKYNGISDQNPVVIIKQPWMLENSFKAAMHANMIDVVEGKMEENEIHKMIERPSIKKPYRPSMETKFNEELSM